MHFHTVSFELRGADNYVCSCLLTQPQAPMGEGGDALSLKANPFVDAARTGAIADVL